MAPGYPDSGPQTLLIQATQIERSVLSFDATQVG
jgi:hypothetical protein